MGFRYTEHVTTDKLPGYVVKFRRPGGRQQLGWESFVATITDRSGEGMRLEADELEKIQTDLSQYMVSVNGETVNYTADELDAILSPGEAVNLWLFFLGACKLPESEKKRSVTLSPQPCTLEAGTIVPHAPIKPNGSGIVDTT